MTVERLSLKRMYHNSTAGRWQVVGHPIRLSRFLGRGWTLSWRRGNLHHDPLADAIRAWFDGQKIDPEFATRREARQALELALACATPPWMEDPEPYRESYPEAYGLPRRPPTLA